MTGSIGSAGAAGGGAGQGAAEGRWLGCVLAGGESRRFGSDKALAMLGGETLLARAVAMLAGPCAAVVIAGREAAPAPVVADWPHAGLGPLGGLAGALRAAEGQGFDAVLSVGVDSLELPDLADILSPGPACLAAQPVVGLWPVATLGVLTAILTGGERRSMLHFADRCWARLVELAVPPVNVNTPEDLARLCGNEG